MASLKVEMKQGKMSKALSALLLQGQDAIEKNACIVAFQTVFSEVRSNIFFAFLLNLLILSVATETQVDNTRNINTRG